MGFGIFIPSNTRKNEIISFIVFYTFSGGFVNKEFCFLSIKTLKLVVLIIFPSQFIPQPAIISVFNLPGSGFPLQTKCFEMKIPYCIFPIKVLLYFRNIHSDFIHHKELLWQKKS
jgi:hypothetical protein